MNHLNFHSLYSVFGKNRQAWAFALGKEHFPMGPMKARGTILKIGKKYLIFDNTTT